MVEAEKSWDEVAFNSTRCIRNGVRVEKKLKETFKAFNSTRCIRNKGDVPCKEKSRHLSTPHGALGTKTHKHNSRKKNPLLSTPHGALGTLFRTSLPWA